MGPTASRLLRVLAVLPLLAPVAACGGELR